MNFYNTVDLHTHSVLSKHAYSSVTENIDEAIKKGLMVLGISEHQYDEAGVGAHYFGISNISVIPRTVNNLKILRGVELNILPDGLIDTERLPLNKLDYAIASMHRYVYPANNNVALNTQAYIKVMDYPFVRIIGHMDRDGYPCDYNRVVACAKEKGKIIELNNSSLIHDNDRIKMRDFLILKLCREYNVPVIINSDAHIRYDVGNYRQAFEIVEAAEFPLDLLLNYNHRALREYFPILG